MPGLNPYNPYNQSSVQMYKENLKNIMEQARGQLQQLDQMPMQQPMSPVPITQNFQIAPQSNNPNDLQSSYVNNIDEVRNIFMQKNGVFVNKDLSNMWFKNTEGKIRTFTITEIIEKDEKDIQIDNLKKENDNKNFEINNLRQEIENMRTLILQKNNTPQESQPNNVKNDKKK